MLRTLHIAHLVFVIMYSQMMAIAADLEVGDLLYHFFITLPRHQEFCQFQGSSECKKKFPGVRAC